MINKVSEIQIVPIKPKNGLLAFASLLINDSFYVGSIGIYTRPTGGLRITYPTKKMGDTQLPIFHPINKECGDLIEKAILEKFNELQNII